MAKLTIGDVQKVADLAKLTLTSEEITIFSSQLSKVVDYISELSEVDTKDIEPVSQTTGLTNVKREDKIDVTRILTQDEALSGANKTKNGFFVVKKIISK